MKEVYQEIYNQMKDVKPLPSPVAELRLIPFEPIELEKILNKKFGTVMVAAALKQLFDLDILGMRIYEAPTYVKGRKQKEYYINLDKLKEIL